MVFLMPAAALHGDILPGFSFLCKHPYGVSFSSNDSTHHVTGHQNPKTEIGSPLAPGNNTNIDPSHAAIQMCAPKLSWELFVSLTKEGHTTNGCSYQFSHGQPSSLTEIWTNTNWRPTRLHPFNCMSAPVSLKNWQMTSLLQSTAIQE